MTTPRKPRAMPKVGDTSTAIEARAHALWVQIRADYITAPSAPTLEDLARKYAKQIGYEAIKRRCAEEKWSELREEWWKNAEVALLHRIQDEYLLERLGEMRLIRQAMPLVFEHLLPVTEPDPDRPGERRVRRDPDTGMPVFRHGFKSQEGVVKTWLLLQERQMLLRGEATMRTDSAIRDREPAVEETDPLAHMASKANFSRTEVRSLARQMVAKRLRAEAGEPEPEDEEDGEEETEDGGDEI